jgi:hypothetical protein
MGRNNGEFDVGYEIKFKDAKHTYQLDPDYLEPGFSHVTGRPVPADKYVNAKPATIERQKEHSQILLDAVHTAPKNDMHLYRGTRPNETGSESPFSSWSTDERTAKEFAGEKGKVISAAPGTVQALRMPRGNYSEGEYLVKNPKHPYWKGK